MQQEIKRIDTTPIDACYSRPDKWYSLKYSMLEERLEQVREIDGELAYEKMRRAVEKASQETARQTRERRGPERGGPERDFGPNPRLQAHPSMRKCFPPAVALCHGRAGGPARGGSGAGYAWPYSAARRCHRMAPFALDRGVDQGGCPYQRLAAPTKFTKSS